MTLLTLQRIGGRWIAKLEGEVQYQEFDSQDEEEVFLDDGHEAELDLVNIYTGIPTKALLSESQHAKVTVH